MFQSYESTRDRHIKATSSQAVLKGIAEDGGLYVMRSLNEKNIDLKKLIGKSYIEIAETVLETMLDDFPKDKIKECVKNAYTNKFSHDDVAPLVKVGDNYVLELFHGRTSAFKDFALSILPYLMTTSFGMNKIEDEVVILTATSGDTGKAALEGFKDVDKTKVIVFYPQGGVSTVQKAQMETQEGFNTFVCSIEGNFDDAQTGVKRIFQDKVLIKELKENKRILSSANSINVGRLVPQIVYYFASYMKLVEEKAIKIGEEVNFSVPTGNFGNILAGYYAKCVGLPINKLLCGSNENNVLYDFIKTGVYDKNRQFYKTISPSMDILVSSNLERLLYYISGCDNEMVKELMAKLDKDGRYEITNSMKNQVQSLFYAGCYFKEQVEKTIKSVFDTYNYLLDTHTAVAYKTLEVYQNETKDKTVSVVLSTASPFKFSKSVYEALYGNSDKDEFEIMKELSSRTKTNIPENLKGLENKKVLHNNVCNLDSMKDFVVRTITNH